MFLAELLQHAAVWRLQRPAVFAGKGAPVDTLGHG
jgi:hypothetical protein